MFDTISKIISVKNEAGLKRKIQIIKENKYDEDFCKLLYYSLNPFLTYKISEQTIRKSVYRQAENRAAMNDFFDICETLSKMNALDNETVCTVCAFVRSLSDQNEAEVYIQILSKTLRLGVTAKTVNKVIPGLIPEWEVQQAFPIDKYHIPPGTWFTLTQKLNGVRATYYNGQLYARSGLTYTGLEHIADALSNAAPNDLVFDGELTLKDRGGLSDNEAFRVATGIINSDAVDKTMICFTVFDVIPAEEFESGASKDNYSTRRLLLNKIETLLSLSGSVKILPILYCGTNQSKIDELLDQMVREDKEGLMLNLDVPYQRKRHSGILKIKRFYTMDLPILRCEEGSGRLKGTLGALILDYMGNEVGVGSGFTDEQRHSYWQRRDSLPGTLCEVKYKEISSDKNTGNKSLQFPVFIQLRTDKDDVSFG